MQAQAQAEAAKMQAQAQAGGLTWYMLTWRLIATVAKSSQVLPVLHLLGVRHQRETGHAVSVV